MHLLLGYAMSMLGINYLWGGENPISGMDCSGLVQEILRSTGVDPVGDQTAQGLFDHFERKASWDRPGLGSLVFYGKSVTAISHVAFMVDQYRVIEAGHGDSTVTSREAAAKRGAFVRLRPIDYRADRVAILKPSYPKIGAP